MIKLAFLMTTLYVTPTYEHGGDHGIYGFKLTQKIAANIYFKIRVKEITQLNKDPSPVIDSHLEIDF